MVHRKLGMVIACAALVSACTSVNASDSTEVGTDSTVLATASVEEFAEDTNAVVLAENTEAPVIDVSFSYECKIFGKREDNSYPMNGKEVGRIEFSAKPTGRIGHASARIAQQNSEAVVVHWWCDAFSGIEYHLQVWAKQ